MASIIHIVSYLILFYFVLLTIAYTLVFFASLPDVLLQYEEIHVGDISKILETIQTWSILSIIVPIYNEKRRVLETIYSVLHNIQPPVDLILVNDESTDNTMEILKEELQLYEVPNTIRIILESKPIRHVYFSKIYPHITVIDKEHGFGSGADSVNAGVNACKTPLFMTVDADTVLEPEALNRLLFAFFSQPHCVTIGGAVYVLNGIEVNQGRLGPIRLPPKTIPAFQAIEYVRSFLFGRAGFNILSGALCYAGAFTLLEKQAVIESGGYDRKNFSYDAEIIVKLHDYMRQKRYPYTAYFTSNSFAWTIVPATIKSYWRQRNFWQRGLLRTFMKHKHMLFNPRYGIVGLFNVPFYIFFEVLGPVVEFFSYLMIIAAYLYNLIDVITLFWALVLAAGFSAFLNLANFLLNIITYKRYNNLTDVVRVLYLVIIEMFGFRQLRAACCFIATCQYFWNRLRGRYL